MDRIESVSIWTAWFAVVFTITPLRFTQVCYLEAHITYYVLFLLYLLSSARNALLQDPAPASSTALATASWTSLKRSSASGWRVDTNGGAAEDDEDESADSTASTDFSPSLQSEEIARATVHFMGLLSY